MKQNYTDIIIVLDRSGSMQSVRNDTIGGVNKFIEEQQKVPGEATFSLFQFDHEYERVNSAVPIKDAQKLNDGNYVPRGNTCLYGAIGCGIRDAGDRLKNLSEDQRPEKVIFVIVTDGEENSSFKHEWSQSHTAASIKADIERQSKNYKWEFVYIGANQNAITNAGHIGIAATHAMDYAANEKGTRSLYASLSANVSAHRMSARKDMSWEADQRKEQDQAKV